MLNNLLISAISAALIVLPTPAVFAHSGGLDSNGCHAGSRPYHCHRGSGSSPRSTSPSRSGGDLNCADFSSWREAQRVFEQSGPSDPHRLDGDNDGIACEALR
ncbi:YHYH domain-containing protein [Rhodobacteraceae bacterium WD3A24]|nr:YHYH domain-containing protein [Rhodobacteraceae bacterium WD3A24]